jgi:hypothetical protein
VAVGETVAAVVTAALLVRAAAGFLGIELRLLGERIAPVVRAAAVMAAAVLAATTALVASSTPAEVRLIAGAATGAAVFWLALGVERGPLLCEARRGLRNAVAPAPAVEGCGDVR